MSLHHPTTRELDCRVTDGIQVRMLWSQDEDAVTIAVIDLRNGDSFMLVVQPGEQAYDVFHHPFAYAAAHNVVTGVPVEFAPAA
jgi:hypothetical protein